MVNEVNICKKRNKKLPGHTNGFYSNWFICTSWLMAILTAFSPYPVSAQISVLFLPLKGKWIITALSSGFKCFLPILFSKNDWWNYTVGHQVSVWILEMRLSVLNIWDILFCWLNNGISDNLIIVWSNERLTEVLPNHYLFCNHNLHSFVINLICCLTHFDSVGWHNVQFNKGLISKSKICHRPFFCHLL